MESKPLRPHQTALVSAAVAAAVGYAVPIAHLFLLPLQYLNTHIHELCHAIAAIGTGGDPAQILVFANGSGVTPVSGGLLPLVASAGYVGASLIGGAIILLARTPERAKTVLRVLAGMLAFSMLVWVRGDVVGIISGIAWIGILWALSSYLKGMSVLFVTQFIGLQQCLNALGSMYTLLQISAYPSADSDAKVMASVTHVPSMFWALAWTLFSLVAMALTLRKAWSSTRAG